MGGKTQTNKETNNMETEINVMKHILDAAQSMLDSDLDSTKESLQYAMNEIDMQTMR